jgi:hypothetical protein
MNYNIYIEKEYTTKSKNTPIIGCLMMVKNESKRILVSLNSIVDTVDCLIIYDTGSEDDTKELIVKYCDDNKLSLYMITGDFIDFSTSRNISLDYADTKNVDYLLLLDCNDELKNGNELLQVVLRDNKNHVGGYLVKQSWWSGSLNTYYNLRFIKARCNFRFKGVVHEYLSDEGSKNRLPVNKIRGNLCIYQDRTKDGNKSFSRFETDKKLLLREYEKDPDPRTVFYLAQTFNCLGDAKNAYKYYKIRSEQEGFREEKFHSYLLCGELSEKLKFDWEISLGHYMNAISHTPRAEPLVKLASHYKDKKNWLLSYHFAKMACELEFPSNLILFVDVECYSYFRWHTLGIVSYYCSKFEDGRDACLKAIKEGKNIALDTSNLEFYTKKLSQ